MTQFASTELYGGPTSLDVVVLRLQEAGPLPAALVEQVLAATSRSTASAAKTILHIEEDPVRHPRWLVSGWACRYRHMSDGRRLIFDVILPGEGVGVCLKPKPIANTSILALTPVELADARDLLAPATLEAFPALSTALQANADSDERRLLNHLMRLGRMSAVERMAHLLLELHQRLAAVGLANGGRFRMPLTQETLSDMLGLSVVHANRTLQELRRQELVTIKAGWAHLHDRPRLANLADCRLRAARAPLRLAF